jgi:hypothetical protein
MRRSFLAAAVIPAVAFAAVSLGSTREAAASGTTIDLDLNLGTAFQSNGVSQVDFSAGGGARIGYRFNIPQSYVYVQPEGGIHYMRFGFNADSLGYDYAVTVNGGLKLGIQGIVQPNIFGHLGLGALGYAVPGGSEGFIGPALDVGAGLDFRIVPGFLLGAQIAYNSVVVPSGNQDSAKWVTFGLTAGFHFGDAPPRRVVYRRGYY